MARLSVLFCLLVSVYCALPTRGEDANSQPSLAAPLLAQARALSVQRRANIARQVAWLDELRQATPAQIATYAQRRDAAFGAYIAAVRGPEKQAQLEKLRRFQTDGMDQLALVRGQLSPLVGLARPAEFSTWAVDVAAAGPIVVRYGNGGLKDDLAVLLVQGAGRRAAIEIVRRLTSQPGPEEKTAARLHHMLKAIEGPATEAFLQHPTTLPPLAVPEHQRVGLTLSFMLVPGFPDEHYQGPETGALARLTDGTRVADPDFKAMQLYGTKAELRQLLARQQKLGDIAFIFEGMLVTTSGFRSLEDHAFAAPQRDLYWKPADFMQGPVAHWHRVGSSFLVRTADDRTAVVQILGGGFNSEQAIAFAVLRDDQQELPAAVLPSEFAFVLSNPPPNYAAIVARSIYVSNARSRYFDQFRSIVERLEDLLKVGSKASLADRIAAVRLLGELRADESAIEMVVLLGTGEDPALETAIIETLREMIDRSRYAFNDQMQIADADRLARLREAQVQVEGKAAAEAMWAYWKTQPRQDRVDRRERKPAP